MFDIKLGTSSIYWIIGGGFSFVGIVVAATVKVLTRNHIHKGEAYKNLQSKSLCDERTDNIKEDIKDVKAHVDTVKEHIDIRINDVITFLKNNGR